MAGHSKWANIQHHKGIEDKKRAKVFTKHARLIAVAARSGGDPDMNPLLRTAIENARAENVPRDNIERAIKKGSGEGKDGAIYEEIVYEAFGPGSVPVLIECLTDNRNRAFGDVKLVVNKKGGWMGEANSISWMFERLGKVEVLVGSRVLEEIELDLIDLGAEVIEAEVDLVRAYCRFENFVGFKKVVEDKGFELKLAEIEYVKKDKVEQDLSDEDAKKFGVMIEALVDLDDVSRVYY